MDQHLRDAIQSANDAIATVEQKFAAGLRGTQVVVATCADALMTSD